MPYKKKLSYQAVRVSIKEAIAKNSKTYFTGQKCKYGHVSPRYTAGKRCVECTSDKAFRKKLKLYNRGMTEKEYDDMLYLQRNKCAICNNKLGEGQDVTIDHCHDTNLIRGILCRNCNMGLGQFRDCIGYIKNAAKYLQKFKEKFMYEINL